MAAGFSGETKTDAALSAAASPLGSAISRLAQAQALREAELRHPSPGKPGSPGSSTPIQPLQGEPDAGGSAPGSRRRRAQWFPASPHSSAQMAGSGRPAHVPTQEAGSNSPGTAGPEAALSQPEQEIAAEAAALAAVHQSVDAAMDRAQTQLQASGGLRRLES